MKIYLLFPLLFTALLGLEGCQSNGSPITELGRPLLVPQSQPDSLSEQGIRQDPSTGGILLQWYSAKGAISYKIYRSDSVADNGVPLNFSVVGNVAISAELYDTSMVDDNSIQTGLRYYYYVEAYGAGGTTSEPSDTVSYQLLNRALPRYPVSRALVNADSLYFLWYDIAGGGYVVIRVKDITVIPQSLVWVSRRFQRFGPYPSVSFNFDSIATEKLVRGHSYQWRVIRFVPGGNEGSSSDWSVFTTK